MDMTGFLDVKDLTKHFGGLAALQDVDFSLQEGEMLGVIGPNGAGKTTLFNVITGVYPATKGTVLFSNRDITHMKTHHRARMGLVRSFQQVNIFSELTALQNLRQGLYTSIEIGFWKSLFDTRGNRAKIAEIENQALALLRSLGMEEHRDEMAGALPLGIQKKLGIAIALAANPKVILLDEPISGLNPSEITAVMEFIADEVRKRCTCIIIEHHVKTVMNYCDRILVLNFGKKIAEGLPQEIAKNPEVIAAYLGEE
jgi:branched-chain amino acid transport system ATP-binding protein